VPLFIGGDVIGIATVNEENGIPNAVEIKTGIQIDAICICKGYDPDLCDFQCRLLVPLEISSIPYPYSCVYGGGNCIWELMDV
jgi:hypothetical protein